MNAYEVTEGVDESNAQVLDQADVARVEAEQNAPQYAPTEVSDGLTDVGRAYMSALSRVAQGDPGIPTLTVLASMAWGIQQTLMIVAQIQQTVQEAAERDAAPRLVLPR